MFAVERPAGMEGARHMVEEILADLGLDPFDNLEEEGEDRLTWCVERGSATVYIELFREKGATYFMVDCPILHLPAERCESFFRRLLELNDRLVEGSLCLRGDVVHLVGIRPLEGLDAVEVEGMLDRLSGWADGLDNPLSEEFDAPMWER